MADDDATQRIVSGEAWRELCRALERAGDVVLRDASPSEPFDRAEGFRYLARLARGALEAYLECADPLAPVFRRPAHETLKLGADNPDNLYLAATVSGTHEYRIRGTRGTVHYLGIGSYAGRYGGGGRTAQTGYLDARDLEIAPDGSFEIAVCREARPGNWLPMAEDTSSIIVRETFLDRTRETPAELRIERVGAAGPPPPVTPEAVARGLAAAGSWVRGTAELFAEWAEGFRRRPNKLLRFDPAAASAAHGDPNIVYYHGYWELAPDEALLIEVVPPACEYWNIQVNNYWMESLDYRYHRIALNHHQARLRPDGSVRIVLAHEDPGVENWLETAGHARGTLCLRWVGAREHPDPATRVVKLGALARG